MSLRLGAIAKPRNLMLAAIVLLAASVVFFAVSVQAMAAASGADLFTVLETNPIVSADLLATCGKVLSAMVLFRLLDNQDEGAFLTVPCGLLAVSQFMVQSYLVAMLLALVAVQSGLDLQGSAKRELARESALPTIILLLHVFILVVNLCIAV